MKTLIFISACFFSFACFGQTKLISYRSHSGSDANFRNAVEHNLFDIGASNFGLSVERVNKIDSVIMKGNNKIIVLRKTYDMIIGMRSQPQRVIYTRDTLTKANAADVFTANNMDDLKSGIRKVYTTAKLDSTLFIGFDKKFKQKKG